VSHTTLDKEEIIEHELNPTMGGLSSSEQRVVKVAEDYTAQSPELWTELGIAEPDRQDTAIEGLLGSLASTPVTMEATWDFSLTGAMASVNLGVTIPDQALLTRTFVDVLIPITGATLIDFTINGDSLASLTAASAGPAEGDLDGTAAQMIKTSSPGNVIATLTGVPLTGKAKIYFTYVK
jgi:hypothetical protein